MPLFCVSSLVPTMIYSLAASLGLCRGIVWKQLFLMQDVPEWGAVLVDLVLSNSKEMIKRVTFGDRLGCSNYGLA